LNFIRFYVAQIEQENRPTVITYNPWWFSTDEDIARSFIDQLKTQLKKDWKDRGQKFAQKVEPLGDIADVLGDLEIPIASPISKAIGKAIKSASSYEANIPEIKEKVRILLKASELRIIVIVDDIDRLMPDQIRQVFRVIKSLADFPNVVYLLAFDKDVVTKALQIQEGVSGESYLEKIIQVPVDLPIPEQGAVHNMLLAGLQEIVGTGPEGVFDQRHWSNVFYSLKNFFKTPREVVRLLNALSITYQSVKNEVSPEDFIAIETLRLFHPELYEVIRWNSDMFSGISNKAWGWNSYEDKNEKAFHERWLSKFPESQKELIKQFLQALFPKLSSVWGNTIYSAEYLKTWRKHLRISSPNHFTTYFRLTTSPDQLTNQEIQLLLAAAKDESTFFSNLKELIETSLEKTRAFINRLLDYVDHDLTSSQAVVIARSLFYLGDSLVKVDEKISKSDFVIGLDWTIQNFVQKALMRNDSDTRFKLLNEFFTEGSLLTICGVLIDIEQQHSRFGEKQVTEENDRATTPEQLKKLEGLVLSRINNAIENKEFWDTPNLLVVLDVWKELTSPETVQLWLDKELDDDAHLLAYLWACKSKIEVSGGPVEYSVSTHGLKKHLDAPKYLERIKNIYFDPNTPEQHKQLLKRLVEGDNAAVDE
jgi:predicted KAP-like P-loop ATPase